MEHLGRARRLDLLTAHAAEFAEAGLANVVREFPYDMRNVVNHVGDYPQRPRDVHPAFYGCFDWHSCVEMHWMLVRLLRLVPEQVPVDRVRAVLDAHLTPENLAAETARCRERGVPTRSYGSGWALTLAAELATWDDPDSRRWAEAVRPLAEVCVESTLRRLPKSTYPIRQGAHANSAFGLSRALGWARLASPELLEAITSTAMRWFAADTDYPARWEPDGADFLSPALCEAELMTELLPPDQFPHWFDAFLPKTEFTPAVVSDDTDGQIAHLHGLNLSRAWAMLRIATALPDGDHRVESLLASAVAHAEPELSNSTGSDYMVEHWLAAYAVLYLGEGE
ncbi:DUF2891 domain-containing protein [Kutzneria viridogrisea]|uniref:DUF2891 domain-containing protein n=1 Tax=Kutzneria viridogrisea TaxID=47990 RepID=A0ABR6BLT9_9PSEU|nr:hypothetical protein [Kutzneria viridogrisea]